MNFLKVGITALRNSSLHMSLLFPIHLLAKAEKIAHLDEKNSVSTSQKKPVCFHPCSQSGKQALEGDWRFGQPEAVETSWSRQKRSI